MNVTTLKALRSGEADPAEFLRDRRGGVQMAWPDEDVARLLDVVRVFPGAEFVVSVHSSHGAAATVRLRRLRDPRWSVDGFRYRTRLLGQHGDENRLAAVTVTYRPNEGAK